jgi:hypothetical protein
MGLASDLFDKTRAIVRVLVKHVYAPELHQEQLRDRPEEAAATC